MKKNIRIFGRAIKNIFQKLWKGCRNLVKMIYKTIGIPLGCYFLLGTVCGAIALLFSPVFGKEVVVEFFNNTMAPVLCVISFIGYVIYLFAKELEMAATEIACES